MYEYKAWSESERTFSLFVSIFRENPNIYDFCVNKDTGEIDRNLLLQYYIKTRGYSPIKKE
jgi:hypothetical protein